MPDFRAAYRLQLVAVRGDLAAFDPPDGTWVDVLRTPHLLLAERASATFAGSEKSAHLRLPAR